MDFLYRYTTGLEMRTNHGFYQHTANTGVTSRLIDSRHWGGYENEIYFASCADEEYTDTTLQQIKKQMMYIHEERSSAGEVIDHVGDL